MHVICYFPSSVWLAPLSMTISRPMHVAANDFISFFLTLLPALLDATTSPLHGSHDAVVSSSCWNPATEFCQWLDTGQNKSLGDTTLILLRGTYLVFLADPHVLTTHFISENLFSLS